MLLKKLSLNQVIFLPLMTSELSEPYIQVVNKSYVHMPVDDSWKELCHDIWTGRKLKIIAPPIEIVVASKLAANRDKDIDDVLYINTIVPDLKEKVKSIVHYFTSEDQALIEENFVYIDLVAENSLNSVIKKVSI